MALHKSGSYTQQNHLDVQEGPVSYERLHDSDQSDTGVLALQLHIIDWHEHRAHRLSRVAAIDLIYTR